jgi:hypothetical protein
MTGGIEEDYDVRAGGNTKSGLMVWRLSQNFILGGKGY